MEEVKATLQAADNINRLYYLLMLNCACYAIDISSLTKQKIDWKTGRLTYRRVKRQQGKKAKRIPTVTYKLWAETKALLEAHQSDHESLLLTNRNGQPLLKDTRENRTRDDGIGKAWRRTISKKGPDRLTSQSNFYGIRRHPSLLPSMGTQPPKTSYGHAPKTNREPSTISNAPKPTSISPSPMFARY